MIEQQHTPEPWFWSEKYGEICFTSEDDDQSFGMACNVDIQANAIRIITCVNACAGFSNDELEGANLHKDSIDAQNEIDELRADLATAEQDSRQKQAMIDRLERERDELLAALEDVKIYFQDTQSQLYIYDRVTKCVASVKGDVS